MSRAAALALAAVPACAWGDGEPMGSISVELAAAWTPLPERANGDWQRLASDYEVQVTDATATLGALTLVDVGTAALAFDPANPPPGYTLCHAGHCHAADGRLVSYEEISAELTGGAGPAPVLALPAGERDLVPGGIDAPGCEQPCDLPLADVGRVELEVEALALAGIVRDRRDPPRIAGEVAWTLTFAPAAPIPVTASVDLPVDRGHDPRIELVATFAPTAALLDEVAFDDAALDPTPIGAALGELGLDVAVTRSE